MTRMTLEKTTPRANSDHFADFSKMVPAGDSERPVGINAEARELETRIAENVGKLLEAS
jgi:hypothetical protein